MCEFCRRGIVGEVFLLRLVEGREEGEKEEQEEEEEEEEDHAADFCRHELVVVVAVEEEYEHQLYE